MDVRYAVRRWYSIAEVVDGRRIEAVRVDERDHPTEDDAREAYARALRRRWVPADALDAGVEAIGFRPDAGAGTGPRGAVERLRAAGRHDEAAALERLLERPQGHEGAA